MGTLKRFLVSAFVVSCLFVFNPTSSHALLAISGSGGLGSFVGSIDYSNIDGTSATLDVSLTNTSPVPNGGYLTAIAFDVDDLITSGSIDSTDTNFTFIDGVSVSPYGSRDYGAGLGGDWLGGGTPTTGIAVGDTGNITFLFGGTDLDQLSDSSFENIIVRFRGFENKGSDKVPEEGCEEACEPVVPEPATMALFGTGMMAAALARRKQS